MSQHHVQRLFVRSTATPRQMLLARLSLVLAIVAAIIAVLWWDRGGLKDQIDGDISFIDVLYFTAVSITTVGYGDIVPVSERARLIDTIFVTPARLFVWLLFMGTAYELLLQKWIENWRMKRLRDTLKGHVIICGYGQSGSSAAEEARKRGDAVVVIDRDATLVQRAADAGHIGLVGDCSTEADLQEAGIATAGAVLVTVGRDDTTVLVALTARNLNRALRIICNVAMAENVKLIQQAGADVTVLPSQVGGYLMADAVRSQHVSAYITDLLTNDGRVNLIERPANEADIGLRLRDVQPEMALRLYRQGQAVSCWEGEASIIRRDDILLLVVPCPIAGAAAGQTPATD